MGPNTSGGMAPLSTKASANPRSMSDRASPALDPTRITLAPSCLAICAPAKLVPFPQIGEHPLPSLDPRYRGAGVDDYAEGIAPRDVNGCGVAPAEHRHREAQRCEVGVEVRPRGQDRHEDTFCVAAVKAGDRNPLQPESSGRRAVSVPVNQKRVHRFGEGGAEGRVGREGRQSAGFGGGSGHDSSMRALLWCRDVVPDGIFLWIPKTIA